MRRGQDFLRRFWGEGFLGTGWGKGWRLRCWHAHPGGQVLIVTANIGYYQEKGKPAQLLVNGSVVAIAPDVVHWHGTAPYSEFTPVDINPNIQNGVVAWLNRVSDEEYNNL